MILLLLFISFSAYAVMWTLQFRLGESIFKKLNKFYWDPYLSWQNKWNQEKLNKGLRIERFLGSSTIFVWLTDAFHLFQFIFLNSLFLVFSFMADGKEALGFTFHWWSAFAGIRIVYALVFEGLFGWILIKK